MDFEPELDPNMNCVIPYALFVVLAVDLLALTGDTTMTWTSPMFPKLNSTDPDENPFGKPISDDDASWIGSLVNIGAMIGPIFFRYLSDKVGRKITLLSIAAPHLIAFITLAFAKNVYLYFVARLLNGFSVGGSYTVLPTYIAEISHPSYRGMATVSLGVFWALGNLIPYCIGPYLPTMWFNLTLCVFPLIFITLFSVLGPETPYYLVGKNQMDKAKKSLMRLRSKTANQVEKELQQIALSLEDEEKGHFYEILKTKALRKALLISLVLISANQLCGINAFLFYLQPIFQASGTDIKADLSAIIVGLVLFTSSIIAPFVADRWGRRALMMISSFGMVVALVPIGVYFQILDNGSSDSNISAFSWIPITSLVVYIVLFNMGMTSIPWIIPAELFPSSFRSIAASTTSFTCWFISFLITKFFTQVTDLIGKGPVFLVFGLFSLLSGLFTIFMVPETKGKSFSEIQKMLN